MISEVCRLMAEEIAAKDIRIETDLEQDLPSVTLDRVQVQQVFVNLIRNGIEAMDVVVDAARTLQIRSYRDGFDAIRVEVRDGGTGFKQAERVFEPFFTTKQHGMGMGLAICRTIIESHGGRLWTANNLRGDRRLHASAGSKRGTMSPRDEIVFVVDDDARVREALGELLESLGWRAVTFAAAADYVASTKPDLPGCLVLDIELPDINGLEFQKQLSHDVHPPLVFITGHGDIPSSVRAIQRGAVNFLTKPVGENDLIAAVRAAIDRDRVQRSARAELAELGRRLAALTPREREVLPLVVSGLLNKQVAAKLGISEVTIEIHRSKIMHKMQAASLADLVRIAQKLQIPVTHSRRSGSS